MSDTVQKSMFPQSVVLLGDALAELRRRLPDVGVCIECEVWQHVGAEPEVRWSIWRSDIADHSQAPTLAAALEVALARGRLAEAQAALAGLDSAPAAAESF